MAKTEATKKIESVLIKVHQREYGCPEVSMGFGTAKDGRVDYMVMDSKGIFKCYEIKVSKADFRSGNINSFDGHYNYYAMPEDLYFEVRDEIPDHVGVVIPGEYPSPHLRSIKKAKRQDLNETQVLKLTQYLARSLARDANRYYEIHDDHIVPKLKKEVRELTKSRDDYQLKYDRSINQIFSLENDLDEIFGEDFRSIIREKAAALKKSRREVFNRKERV